MEYSNILKKHKKQCRILLDALLEKYEFASILGSHRVAKIISVDDHGSSINNRNEAGYTIRLYKDGHYYEYATDTIDQPVDELVCHIQDSLVLDEKVSKRIKKIDVMHEEKLTKVFSRLDEGKVYTIKELKEELTKIHDTIKVQNQLVVAANVRMMIREESSMYLSPNKDLEQFYTWTNLNMMAVVRNEKGMKNYHASVNYNNNERCILEAYERIPELVDTAIMLLDATAIEPGYYDVVVDPSVAGLIAHEAFGHGVELDMFVKHRAKAVNYVNDYVASPIVSMKDGAASTLSAASYFFDDDGILAHDTLEIEKGILKHGISDSLSALQLHQEPTGNGRKESYLKKSYSRMTNTFFLPGNDKVEDMIASIDHGYMICGSSNGMEDPKNWQIQCVATYGKEIKDGKFTGKIVAPVVISGYVPDLLKSISMLSEEYHVFGSGMCGKGFKEWVYVSDGGPYMKAKVKLG